MHKNNFDFLRLIFAIFVIITHLKPLSLRQEGDWLMSLTDDQLCFSYLGVRGFFIISGFLIFQSL
ncbi:MAG: acyltransferase, partial [Bacteroidia bacterium]|nr:acyltransferase [Bacteroidia bacterium]